MHPTPAWPPTKALEPWVQLSRSDPTWVPGAEVRGEGVFIELPEDKVQEWLDRAGGTPMLEALRKRHQLWRTRRGLDPSGGWPGERYVLLHTLAHALILALSLEAGYSSASIRERIYAREPGPGGAMAGILLYTAATDSEGTLGGLVRLGQPQHLGRMLEAALDRSRLCSSDPICAERMPDADDESLHNAACHACLFVPETCCEIGNRYLDRAVLVDTLAQAGIGYFTAMTRSLEDEIRSTADHFPAGQIETLAAAFATAPSAGAASGVVGGLPSPLLREQASGPGLGLEGKLRTGRWGGYRPCAAGGRSDGQSHPRRDDGRARVDRTRHGRDVGPAQPRRAARGDRPRSASTDPRVLRGLQGRRPGGGARGRPRTRRGSALRPRDGRGFRRAPSASMPPPRSLPWSGRPRFYVWPAAQRPPGGKLHVKAAIADEYAALVTSANLTGAALNENMELGLLVKGGSVPRRLSRHFMSLIDDEVLERV